MFFLDFDNSGYADLSVAFGEPDDLPVIGDWDGDGDDNIGLYRIGSTTGVFYLDIDNDGGIADIVTPEYGDLGDIPIAGDWDGYSDDNIGVYRPGTGEFFMDAMIPDVLPSKTIYVDADFDDDPSEHRWDTIQEGVADASDGDTVIVYAGEYVENVDVDKSITLRGAGADVVTVTAADAGDHVFEVNASWVNISGFTVTGATDDWKAGVYISNAKNHCNTFDNNASDNWCGIYLCSSNNNMLMSNTANSNNICIHLRDSSNYNTLTNNNASNSYCGIYLYSSSNNKLTDNNASSNDYGIRLWDSSNNTFTNNNANSNDWYGIFLGSSSNNNTLYHNNLIDNTNQNAYDDGTNTWDSGSAGNYYSDYTGTDPHPIPGGTSVDHFPLMQPWTPPQKGDLNGDGIITPADAAIALAIAVGGGSASWDPTTLAAADVNHEGQVTSLEVLIGTV